MTTTKATPSTCFHSVFGGKALGEYIEQPLYRPFSLFYNLGKLAKAEKRGK